MYLGYQDSLGQYSFGYSAPGSARSEVRTSNGATRGTYSYVDETGVIQIAQYVADGENGFRVIATNLPQAPLPVQDTPEVMAARTAHLQALEMATKRDEAEARSHGKNLEDARRRKIEGDHIDQIDQIDQMTPETNEEQTGAKSTESESKEEEKRKASKGTVRNVDPTKDPDRKGEKSPQGIHEASFRFLFPNFPARKFSSPLHFRASLCLWPLHFQNPLIFLARARARARTSSFQL